MKFMSKLFAANVFNLIDRFKKDDKASVQIMAAASIFVAITAISVVVDAGRLYQSSQTLRSMSDNSALAAAMKPELSQEERESIFGTMMNMNVIENGIVDDLDFELSFTETDDVIVLDVTTTAQARLLIGLFGDQTKTVVSHTQVTVGKENIEVSLVLDISSSMKGTRITEMQAAAKSFVQLLLEDENKQGRVSISIIPFGGTVRIPEELSPMLADPGTTEHWTDGTWNQCLTMNHDDIDTGISPTQKYDSMPSFYVWNYANPWCPTQGNELMGLSEDMDAMHDKIDSFTLSDGTGTNVAAAWGYASLDPAWRGYFPNTPSTSPRNFSSSTKKVMVVMSDGGITQQFAPKDSQMDNNPIYWTRNKTETYNEVQANFVEICDIAKSNDIEVYTVGFSMKNEKQQNALKACATNETRHYETDLGGLQTVFINLASSISSLRISK